MATTIQQQAESLAGMSITELRLRYEEAFGEITTSRHRRYLIKRILWRIQANLHGGLSKKALARARQLADPSDLRLTGPAWPSMPEGAQTVNCSLPKSITSNQSILAPGTQLERMYKGQKIIVTIMENGVRWNGELYRSLSAVAKAVTGSHWNGKLFFGVSKHEKRS